MLIPPPSQIRAIIGHDAAKRQIEEAYDSGRMPHAWLLTGIEGIGKASLAFAMAHLVLSGGANRFAKFNPEQPTARLIAAESHPDLLILRRPTDEKTGAQKDSISVEEARKITPFLRMTAAQGGGRMVIIDEAHAMGRNAQNAILKMIEEPPSGAVIAMTATTVGSLLPTIRSRCRVLALEPLSLQQIETALARLGVEWPGGVDKARLVRLSGGSVGMVLKFLQSEAIPFYDEALAILAEAPSLDMARLHRLADQIGKKAEAEAFAAVTDLLTEALRKAAAAAARGEQDEEGLAARLAPTGRLDKLLEIWEKTRRAFSVADGANLDNKLAFIVALTEVAKTAG